MDEHASAELAEGRSVGWKAFLERGVMLCLLATSLALAFWWAKPEVVLEGGLVELAQASLLLGAGLVHLARWRGPPRGPLERPAAHELESVLHPGLALFSFSLFMREVDIDAWTLMPGMARVETGARATVAMLWCVYLVRSRHALGVLMARPGSALRRPAVGLALLASLLYALSWPFDKSMVPLAAPVSMWFEETLQLNATLILFIGAWSRTVEAYLRG